MIGRVLSKVMLLMFLCSSAVLSQNPSPEGNILISEVFVRSSNQNDSWQWVELYNRSNQVVDLSSYSIGSAGNAGVDQNYIQTLIQLSGSIEPHSFFVVGGLNSDATNGNPKFDLGNNFNPDFADGHNSADGVALYKTRAKDVQPQTIPVDVVIYGNNSNNNRLIDNNGDVGVVDIKRPDFDSSLERVSAEPNFWRVQTSPSPNSIISLENFKMHSSAPPLLRLAAEDSLLIIIRADVLDSFGEINFRLENNPGILTELSNQTSVCKKLPCTSSYLLMLAPQINDAGQYSFSLIAEYSRAFGSASRTVNFNLVVVPKILDEPVYSPNLINEIKWVPLNAFNQELIFFPEQNLRTKENVITSTFVGDGTSIVTETIENLTEGIRYGYYIKALVEKKDEFVELFSDTVFSTQDNSPPKPVLVDTSNFKNDGTISIGWDKNSLDQISYIEEFIVNRKAVGDAEFMVVGNIYPKIVKELSPEYLLPESRNVGEPYFLDKPNKLESIPYFKEGSVWLRTNSKDRWNKSEKFISFLVSEPTRVYIGYDKGMVRVPDWLASFEKSDGTISLSNIQRPFEIYYKDFQRGEVVLGGNFAKGADFEEIAPEMYLAILETLTLGSSPVFQNMHTFTDQINTDFSGEQFIYRVDAVDVVGNLAVGIDSKPITLDATPPCIPVITKWFDFKDPDSGINFKKGDFNTICTVFPECGDIATADSVKYEAVRDSLKFFDLEESVSLPGRTFRSEWFPKDSLCHTFLLQPNSEDPNFVNGHKYFYRVRAKDRFNNLSGWSEIKSSIQDVFPPSDISNLTARVITTEKKCVELRWQNAQDPVSGIKSYLVYRSLDGVNYTKIDSISGGITTHCDDLTVLTGSNRVVYYKIGSVDFVNNSRTDKDTDWVASVPIFISPRIYAKPSQLTSCLGDLQGTKVDTLRIQWGHFDEPGVVGFQIEINGPEGSLIKNISNSDAVSFNCPLELGDGVYKVKLLANYINVVEALYSNTITFRKKTSIANIQNIVAERAKDTSGNIMLSWFHPDTADIIEFQIYNWVEGQEIPEEPIARLSADSLTWVHEFDAGLINYQCNYYGVKAFDCFGLESEITNVVAAYPNRPPTFKNSDTIITDKDITICWERVSPRVKNDDAYEVTVEIHQDSLSLVPFETLTVFNQQCATYFSPTPKHNYIFKIKEVVVNELGQECAQVFESAFSEYLTVPYQNPPKTVEFNVQALPVHPDSSTGKIFVEWGDFSQNAINTFLVRWHEKSMNGLVDSIHVTNADTFLITGRDIDYSHEIDVFSIDSLLQRSIVGTTKIVDFNPKWLFTPQIKQYNPKCFKDSVRIEWNWVLENKIPSQNSFGADSVQIEISIDSNFVFKKTTVNLGKEKSFTFIGEQHYPFVTNQNNLLYSRVRAKDRWGHFSPWSTEYTDFIIQPASFDFTPPELVECTIDSIKAPIFGTEGVVNIYLSWNDVTDNCSGTWYYEIFRNDSLVSTDTSRTFNHQYIERNLSTLEPITEYSWSVNAVDSAGNRQEVAPKCKLSFLLTAPDSGWCINDTTLFWSEITHNIPDIEISYFVEGARFSSLFGNEIANIQAGPLSESKFNFDVPWEGIYWRIKAVANNVESAWSETFFCGDFSLSDVTSVSEAGQKLPENFSLFQNYPNPFNPTTTISFTIPKLDKHQEVVRLEIFNISGQKVSTILNEEKLPGLHRVQWHGVDDYGNAVGSGVYVYSIIMGDFKTSRKMIFLK